MSVQNLHSYYCNVLTHYLPQEFVSEAAQWITEYNFDLKITKARSSKLGDYTSPQNGSRHKITINHNLNPYAFLITLVHEIAHLVTFNKYRHKAEPHGTEWKNEFRHLMFPIIQSGHLPLEISRALHRYMMNPAASSCSDANLHRTLRLFDNAHLHEEMMFVEQIPFNREFDYQGRIFVKGVKARTRFKCIEKKSGNTYLFNAVTEVKLVQKVDN